MVLAAALPLVAAAGDCRPETWFHIIGGNASKAGLTADLEALRDAGDRVCGTVSYKPR